MKAPQLAVLLIFLIGSVLALPSVVSAAAKEGKKPPPVSRLTYQRLERVQKLFDEGKYRESLKQLSEVLPKVKDKAYESALLLRAQASAYIGLGNYAQAAKSLERTLATEGLPTESADRVEYDLARLYMALERYAKASGMLSRWIKKTPEPPVEAYVLLGQALAQQSRWRESVSPLRKAIRKSSSPKENWYQLLLAAYYELKDYEACKRLLKVMVKRYPGKADYWRQLAGIHQLTNDYAEALAVLEMAYTRALLSREDDLRNLGALYLQQEQPERAARVLSKALDDKMLPPKARYYRLLGDARYLARDRKGAAVALRRAAELSNDGNIWLRLAQIAATEEQWSEVVNTARKALRTKRVRRPGSAHMLLGIALFELDDKAAAEKAMVRAAKYPKTREQAESWLGYLREEMQARVTDDEW